MSLARVVLILLICAACRGDESVFAYGAADKTWQLIELDGQAFSARATLTFPEPGKISGTTPCNTFSGAQKAPYPWFETGKLALTRAKCSEAADENRFISALPMMTQSEVLGDKMILRNETGREMVFEAL